ncbi:hypothetical protein BC829DRAFT_388743 [Chytridium lagenaria]|nr:hypothetical protein BC829DRAFT_388743 [Chytridium lagenaria]
MQIFIPLRQTHPNNSHPDDTPTPLEDFVLIELQGTLEAGDEPSVASAPGAASIQMFAGKEVGRLSQSGDKYHLVVGKHRLTGKKTALKKPVAVIRKLHLTPPVPRQDALMETAATDTTTATDTMMTDVDDTQRIGGLVGQPEGKPKMKMEIVTVVKWKYVFDARPSVIISEENRGLTAFKKEKG